LFTERWQPRTYFYNHYKTVEKRRPGSFCASFTKLVEPSSLLCKVEQCGERVFSPVFFCGVRQGGVLSLYLFSVYVNDIIVHLRQTGCVWRSMLVNYSLDMLFMLMTSHC